MLLFLLFIFMAVGFFILGLLFGSMLLLKDISKTIGVKYFEFSEFINNISYDDKWKTQEMIRKYNINNG